jgi:hypothetical protein
VKQQQQQGSSSSPVASPRGQPATSSPAPPPSPPLAVKSPALQQAVGHSRAMLAVGGWGRGVAGRLAAARGWGGDGAAGPSLLSVQASKDALTGVADYRAAGEGSCLC